jgi:hypothetical protein
MFSGCAAKLGSNKRYVFPDGASCIFQPDLLLDRLCTIAFPSLGLPILYTGILMGGICVTWLFRNADHLRCGHATVTRGNGLVGTHAAQALASRDNEG